MTGLPPDQGRTPFRETGVQRSSEAPEPGTDDLRTPWRGDWGHELSQLPEPEPPARREPLFSRKVLIGWALLTLGLYFGVRMVKDVINQSVRESVRVSGARGANAPGAKSRPGRVVIMLPNGKRITIDGNGAEVSLPDAPPTLPAQKAEPAPSATPAVPAPKGTELPPKPQKK